MSNRLDPVQLGIEVAVSVAMAQLDELEAQAIRLAALVDLREIDKQQAVDLIYTAARAADLVRVHGDDHIQAIIAEGFVR